MAITQEHIDIAIRLAKEYEATRLLLFGSALEDPENANDLDLGVEGIEPSKFFLFGGVLEDIIRITVDIVPLETQSRFVEHIKKYGKYIYDTARVNQ
jgi:predicted nucleotidyltransferase